MTAGFFKKIRDLHASVANTLRANLYPFLYSFF